MSTAPALLPAPVVYEVTLTADAAIAEPFAAWLREHVDEMAHLPGFLDADIERGDAAADGRIVRVVRYRLESRTALERYIAEDAPAMRAAGVARFGKCFSATRRILEPVLDEPSPGAAILRCGNCEAVLAARYCPACGQDSYSRVTSLRELAHDFIGDYLNFDSRLLRSLGPLIARPGALTTEYLAGRRARYIPPLRLYLFISVAFFFLLSVGALRPVWLNLHWLDDAGKPPAVHLSVEDQAALAKKPPWQRHAVRQAMNFVADPRAFSTNLIGKLPTMMFILLPLFALMLKALYIRRRRYYVEHLIFSFHYHALVFLAAILFLLGYALASRFGLQAIKSNLGLALWLYLTLYLPIAMRRVYRQGWGKTLIKFGLLACMYGLVLIIGLVVTATSTVFA